MSRAVINVNQGSSMPDLKRLKYAKTHEWIDVQGNKGTVGITDFAQSEISDVVFVELPGVGREIKAGQGAMVIESVKAAFDIYAPVSGKVVEVNKDLQDHPEWVNQSPYEKGWLFKVELSSTGELARLLSLEDYESQKSVPH